MLQVIIISANLLQKVSLANYENPNTAYLNVILMLRTNVSRLLFMCFVHLDFILG